MPTLAAFADQFPEIPLLVMLKVDLLRHGVRLGVAPVGSRHSIITMNKAKSRLIRVCTWKAASSSPTVRRCM